MQCAKMLLTQFPNYHAMSFANVVNGDIGSLFEPEQKIQRKYDQVSQAKNNELQSGL